jgi:hypothetical protein
MDEQELVERIDRLVGEGGVADLAGVGRAAFDGDAELEQARGEGLDLAHADAGFGGMEIDRGVGAQSAMQERRDTARMALAGRTGEDDVAQRRLARLEHGLQALHQDGHARQVVGHAPAMQAAVVDHAGKGIALPTLGSRDGLAVGMGEEDDAASLAPPLEPRDHALALARVDRLVTGELGHHRHVARPVAYGLDRAAKPARGVGHQPLHRRLALALGADQALQETDRIGHVRSSPSPACASGYASG